MTVLADFRYALRLLRKMPGFTAAAVLTLALGIGVNCAIFSVVNTVLLKPLPYQAPDRLVALYETEAAPGNYPLTQADFVEWRDRNHSFASVACYQLNYAVLTGAEIPERLEVTSVTPEFFRTLGVSPAFGRDFLPEEGIQGRDRVIILSHGLFQRRFGGDRHVLGRSLILNGQPHTVIGVMPVTFRWFWRYFGSAGEAWIPMVVTKGANRGSHDRFGVGRLRPAVTLPQARKEMSAIATQLEREFPDANSKVGASLVALETDVTGWVQEILFALLGIVGFVLLIACANVANLLLARGVARQQEFAIRAAIGAGRWRLVRQLLTECLLLALIGGALGLALAYGGVYGLKHVESLNVPRLADTTVDATVLLYSFLLTAVAGVLLGLAPAFSQSRRDLTVELNQSGSRTASGGSRAARLRALLVTTELGLAVILLVGAGLMVRTVTRLLAIEPGFRPEGVLTMQLPIPQSRYGTFEKTAAFTRGLLERIRAVPGVTAAGVTNKLPLRGGWNRYIIVEGQSYSTTEPSGPLVETSFVAPGYFQAMGIPLRLGRLFAESDVAENPTRIIVNEAFVRQFLPKQNPIGRRISGDRNPPHWLEIVGVVGDTRQWGLAMPPQPEMYSPEPVPYIRLVVRTALDPSGLTGPIRRALAELDKDVPIAEVMTMQKVIAESSSSARAYMTLIGLLAVVALALAAIGIYGLISFAMSQRRREVGIRMALGATAGDVLSLALSGAAKLIAAGLIVGVAGALLLTQYLKSLLYGVSRFDALTFVGVPLFLAAVALAASLIPALRATRVDPATALRHE